MKRFSMLIAVQAALLLLASSAVVGNEDPSKDSRSLDEHHGASSMRSIRFLSTRFGRGLTGDDDDDDGHRSRRHSKKGSHKHSRKSSKKHNKKDSKKGKKHGHSHDSSSSVTRLMGVLRIVVIGNGDMCFVKIFQSRYSYREQFGDTTSTSAFIDLYGHGECEPGARGVAYGYVRAGVMAEAYQRGPQCEAKVTSFVIAETRDLDPNDGVSVIVGGAAGGEALAVCS